MPVGLSYFNKNGNHYITFDFMNDLKAICIRFEFNKAFLFMRKEVLKLDFKYDNQAENSKKMTGFVGTKENDFNYFRNKKATSLVAFFTEVSKSTILLSSHLLFS